MRMRWKAENSINVTFAFEWRTYDKTNQSELRRMKVHIIMEHMKLYVVSLVGCLKIFIETENNKTFAQIS